MTLAIQMSLLYCDMTIAMSQYNSAEAWRTYH
jgi:hypothetical protein